MGAEGLDCTWCGSACSIEFGICQVCLMEYPSETRIIPLPKDRVAQNRVMQNRSSLERKTALDRKTVIDPKPALDRKNARALPDRVIDLTDKPTLEVAE